MFLSLNRSAHNERMVNIMNKTKRLTTLGVMGALSVLLVTFIHFPLFPSATFLEYDPADVPIFIAAFLFGPVSGLALTVAVSIVQGITVSASSGYIGIIMHILSTGAFVLTAGNIYARNKTKKNAIFALSLGTIIMVAVMTVWNIFITPVFMNVPRSAVIALLIPAIIPFNLIKAGANSIITMVLYKYVSAFVKK